MVWWWAGARLAHTHTPAHILDDDWSTLNYQGLEPVERGQAAGRGYGLAG